MEGFDDVGDAVKIGVGHGGAGGQTQSFLEQLFGHSTADYLVVFEYGLQVHRLPQGAGFDIL